MTRNFNRSRVLSLVFLLALAALSACEISKPEHTEEDVDILSIASNAGFDLHPESEREQSFLEFLLPTEEKANLRSAILLRDDDRVTALYFVHSDNTEKHFSTLKEQTFHLFSSQMSNLIDERVEREGYAPMEILAFTDPAFGEDRFLFAHLKDSLYEFHVAPEKENLVQGLLLEVAEK